jgi:hypothetical protein
MTELPKQIADIVRHREWVQQALDRATAPFGGEPEPDPPASRVEAFQRAQAAQREREQRHEAVVNRVMHENPSPPVDDPLRAFGRMQQSSRVWRRRRGRQRLGL